MYRLFRGALVIVSAALLLAAANSDPLPEAALSGGATTQRVADASAFGMPAANMAPGKRVSFLFGKEIFNTVWRPAVAGGEERPFDGLGPLFSRDSCIGCHPANGRGRPPEAGGEDMASMIVRLGSSATSPHPRLGRQLDYHGVAGVAAEGRLEVSYEERPGRFADGTPYTLRRPRYRFTGAARELEDEGAAFSPRVAPAVYGLGLLEAVPEAALAALADPRDRDGDGISGRLNRVPERAGGGTAVGRFGWKAGEPTVRQQIAGALAGDMGLLSSLVPDSTCAASQSDCRAAASGGTPEVRDDHLDRLTLYTQLLAVPARRDVDAPEVLRGQALFERSGCARCHRPTLETGEHPEHAELSGQTIHPYTDLLLHDMGADLADGRPEHAAAGGEWRTPPLWGLGLLERVNGHTSLLHDGRARDMLEAVLWHGGEAEAAREAVRRMSAGERQALLAFLRSL